MKVATARIRLVLWTSKTLADGTHPILLKISFNGSATLSTHISCKEKDWSVNDECLKRSFPNHVAVNKLLSDIKAEAATTKLKFEADGTPYTAKMVVEGMQKKDLSGSDIVFEKVMLQLIEERHLAYATTATYKSAFNKLVEFIGKRDFILTELTNDIIINFAKSLAQTQPTNSVLFYNGKIQSVCAYAKENELTDHYPSKGFSWVAHNYKKTIKHKALTDKQLMMLQDHFFKIENPQLHNRYTKDFALAFALCCYSAYGVAPIDAAKLKLSNLEDVTIKGQDCWRIATSRSKTKQPLNIIIVKDNMYGQLWNMFISTAHNRDNYIFPIFQTDKHDYNYTTDKQIINAMSNASSAVNENLKLIADELKIPAFTLYSMRHSFASHLVQEGVKIGTIAHALGRNVAGIGCYIKNLTSEEEYLDIARY